MNLNVVKGTREEFEAAIPYPEGEITMTGYTEYMNEKLSDAEAVKAETVSFRSLPMTDKVSDYFMRAGWIEKAIHDFQVDHEYPKFVTIVCDSDKAAEQYKVVYNFYYADSKANRLNDDKWD